MEPSSEHQHDVAECDSRQHEQDRLHSGTSSDSPSIVSLWEAA